MGRLTCFLMCLAFALPGFVRAEEDHGSDIPVYSLDEIVVTATKTSEKRKDITNSVVLLDEISIQESSAGTLGELLANELGVDWRTLGNYGGAVEGIHIRGMSASGTKVLVNGVSVNSPSLGSADVSKIPLNNIERIEVVKGSGSLLYGSGAIGGTINIITKRSRKDRVEFRASAGYASGDTYRLSAEQGMSVWGDLGYYLTANYRDTEGFRDNSDLKHKDVSLRLTLDQGDSLFVSLYGDYVDREYGRPGVRPPSGTQVYFVNGTKFYSSDAASLLDRGGDKDARMVMKVESRLLEWLRLKLRGDYTYMDNYNYGRYSFDGSGQESWVTNGISSVEANLELTPSDGLKILLGSEYKTYDWKNKSIGLDTTGSKVFAGTTIEEDMHTTGSFVEAQYRPFKYVKVLAGVRHEDHSASGRETLPRYGVIFNPWEDTALKLSHGKHFLAPTPNDLFWPREDWGWGMGTEGNSDLNPETGWHSDITVEQSVLDEKIFLTGSYFKWDMDNRILWASDTAGFWRPENLRGYQAEGAELGAKIGPFADVILSLSYTYLDAEEEAEEYDRVAPSPQKTWKTHRATYSPKHQFKGVLSYASVFGLRSSATVRYVSERTWYRNETADWLNYTTAVYELDAYWTVDIKLEQRFHDDWVLSLSGTNLLGEEYDTYFGTFYDETAFLTTVEAFPGTERSFFFSVTYEY